MSESTLSLGFAEFQVRVARYLDLSTSDSDWSSDESAMIDRVIQSGYRRFLRARQWSFLYPVATLATVEDDEDYDLPDDFGILIGPFTYGTSNQYASIAQVAESQIRERRILGTVTAQPTEFALRPKTTDGTDGQRYEVLFWPTPNGAYTLTYKYERLVNKLTSGAPYPYGGMAHAETILQCILAEAEHQENGEIGPEHQLAETRLADSIRHDRMLLPANFGPNSDDSIYENRVVVRDTGYSTIDGVLPG